MMYWFGLLLQLLLLLLLDIVKVEVLVDVLAVLMVMLVEVGKVVVESGRVQVKIVLDRVGRFGRIRIVGRRAHDHLVKEVFVDFLVKDLLVIRVLDEETVVAVAFRCCAA